MKNYCIIFKYLTVNIILMILLIMGTAGIPVSANPLLNANREDTIVYDNILSSINSKDMCMTIGPLSYYRIAPFVDDFDRVRLNHNTPEDVGFYIKPLNSITAKYYYSGEENAFIEGGSGMLLRKGSNFFLFGDAYISLGMHLVAYIQLKQTYNDDGKEADIHRGYGKFLFYKFSLEAGVDNVKLGPGEYGLLLSANASPYPLVKLQTEDHLSIFGKWDFIFLHGWLRETRNDQSNPRLMAGRIVWKPFGFVELGLTRTILFGGADRTTIELSDYPQVAAGRMEGTPDEKYNNDVCNGYDVSLYLPFYKLTRTIKVVKLYWQEASTEMLAKWHKDQARTDGLTLNERAFQAGLLFSTTNNIIRLEYVTTAKTFYQHSEYATEGYSYEGLSLGYPYGSNTQSILFKHRYYFTSRISAEYRLGSYRTPAYDAKDKEPRGYPDPLKPSTGTGNVMKRSYVTILADVRVWRCIVEGYFRYEKSDKYDENPLPTQYSISDEGKSFYTVGVSLSLRI